MTPNPNPLADLFENWLKDNPAPNLQDLVAHWGGWHKVPDVAWNDFTRQNQDWEQKRLERLYGAETWKALQEVKTRKTHR